MAAVVSVCPSVSPRVFRRHNSQGSSRFAFRLSTRVHGRPGSLGEDFDSSLSVVSVKSGFHMQNSNCIKLSHAPSSQDRLIKFDFFDHMMDVWPI